MGKLIVIVAPSGTGKSSLIKELMGEYPQLAESVSNTTREPRPGEVHGKDYFYIQEEEFQRMIDEDCFIEWAKVHTNYYGTSKKFLQDSLQQNKSVILDLDVQGSFAIKKHFGDQAYVIFIAPPSLDELEKRLRGRGTEDEEMLQIRLQNAAKELKSKNAFDALVINNEFSQCLDELKILFKNFLKE